MPAPTNNRRHDLDALRACAMLLGIVLHAGIAYTGFGWLVSDDSHSKVFGWIFYAVHGFRMQLFFLISGFFTAMLYQRKGLKNLLEQRFKRILLPLILFTPIFAGLTERVLQLAWEQQARSVHTWQHFNFHHLWFLWFLCFYVIGFALITKLPKLTISNKWLKSPLCLLYLIPLTTLALSFSPSTYFVFGPETSSGFIPKLDIVAYYAVFYGFGALLYSSPDELITKNWKSKLTLSFSVIFPLGMLIEQLSVHNYHYLSTLSNLLQSSFAWLMVFGCMGFFQTCFKNPSAKMRYLSDASYWLYLAHLPLVLVIQLLIIDWPLSCWIKFPLITLTSLGILLTSYHYCVRGKWIGKFLNGK